MAEYERRFSGTVEVREENGQPSRLDGYAAVFNQETVIAAGTPWAFREVVRPPAFDRALRENQDVVSWYQHGEGAPLPLGRTTSGTLRVNADEHGLRYDVDLPDIQAARDLVTSIKRKDVSESSFAFLPKKPDGEKWHDDETKDGELPLRELLDLDLFDVSPVVFPAYKGTSVGVRDAADVYKRYRDSQQEQAPPSEAKPQTPVENHEASNLRIEIARRRH